MIDRQDRISEQSFSEWADRMKEGNYSCAQSNITSWSMLSAVGISIIVAAICWRTKIWKKCDKGREEEEDRVEEGED